MIVPAAQAMPATTRAPSSSSLWPSWRCSASWSGTILGLATTNLKDDDRRTRPGRRDLHRRWGRRRGHQRSRGRSRRSVVAGSSSTCFSVPAGALNASAQVDVKCTGQTGSGTTTPPFPANASTPTQRGPRAEPGAPTPPRVSPARRVRWHAYRARSSVAHTLHAGHPAPTPRPRRVLPVTAQACTGTGTVTPTPTCTASPRPADPGYAPAAGHVHATSGTAPTFGSDVGHTLPTCNANKVATFLPGMYTSLTSHQHADDQLCRWRLLVPAGLLLLRLPRHRRLPASRTTGRFNDANADIVGGAALGWTPSTYVATGRHPGALPRRRTRHATTSACDTDQPGVLFVFGNDSRFTLTKGHVQLCAYNVSTTAQHLAVWSPPADTTVAGSTANIIAGSNTDRQHGARVACSGPTRRTARSSASGLLANVTANNTVPSILTEAAGQYAVPTAQIPSNGHHHRADGQGLRDPDRHRQVDPHLQTAHHRHRGAPDGDPDEDSARLHGRLHRPDVQRDHRDGYHRAHDRRIADGRDRTAWAGSTPSSARRRTSTASSSLSTTRSRAGAQERVVAAHPYVFGSATTDAVWAVAARQPTARPVHRRARHGLRAEGRGVVRRRPASPTAWWTGASSPATSTSPCWHPPPPTPARTSRSPPRPTTVQPRLVVFTAQRGRCRPAARGGHVHRLPAARSTARSRRY